MTQPDPADYWNGPAVWLFNPLGYAQGAVMFIGPMLFPAGIDPGSTQTAMIVLGPGGGKMTIPPVVQGDPGPSPDLRNVNMTQVPYGDALPSPPASFTKVLPGVFDLNIALNSGAPGESGSFSIATADDFAGSLSNGDVPAWNSATSKFNPVSLPMGKWYNVTGISATGTGAGQVRSLTSITIPAQDRDWIPVAVAGAEVVGTSATQVDLVARLGGSANSQSGSEVGRGLGALGVGTQTTTPAILPTFGGGLLTSGFAQVAAGDTATIWLNCEEQQSTTDTYATGRAFFAVCAAPVA